ncbi:hypothetical protein D4100_07365 [Serratia inhibens]|uniref:Uncharacterized protein n=1 Tax=Serratia inhibens TaxID=2338073 RepID=A0AA93BYE7_9GAMM|nr:hypothetical protein [Serratia inhibens]RJF58558.1 hypothetical protein D4100_07365 [Serratia inhibens]
MSKENALFQRVRDDISFDTLWRQVTEIIEPLSGNLWTDTGDHDPGMTLLQALTWNSADLSYRASLSLNDLLTRAGQENLFPADFGPHQVLTCNTVTEEDYRRALRDLHGRDVAIAGGAPDFLFQDARLIKEPQESRFHWWYDAEKREYSFAEPTKVGSEGQQEMTLRGNYWLYLLPTRYTLTLSSDERTKVERYLADFLANHRNLGEKVSRILWLEPAAFSPQITLELSDDVRDVNQIVAQVFQVTGELLLPPARRYTGEELGKLGYGSEEIFEGPFLQYGWQRDSAALISDKGITLNLSLLFNRLLDIDGVAGVMRFSAGSLPAQITAEGGDAWSWQVASGFFPQLWGDDPLTLLTSQSSPLTLIAKGGINERAEHDKVAAYLSTPPPQPTAPVVMPAGRLRDLAAYTPAGQRLPECYQLQRPDEVIDDRVRELHQFLLPADQQLADGCAELALLPHLLAFTERDKTNLIRGTLWPYAKDSVNQQVHQDYAAELTQFQQQDAAIFSDDGGALNSENFYRELDYLQYLLGYFGTRRAPRPLTLDLADFLATQRAYLAQQPSLGYDRINIRVDRVSALQKRIAARIGLNSECFADNPDLSQLPFYLIEHRQLLPLMPDAAFTDEKTPDNFSIAGQQVTLTQKGSAGKIVQGQLVDLILIEESSKRNVSRQLVIATSGDSFTLSTANSKQLANNLHNLQAAWAGKNLRWRNSDVWLQDMDYRLNYAQKDSQPTDKNQRLLASNDQSPYPAMAEVGDSIVIRPATLSLTMNGQAEKTPQVSGDSDDWLLKATVKARDPVTGTVLVEKEQGSQQDFPPEQDAWRFQWSFSGSGHAISDRFSFVVSLVHNRGLFEGGNIDADGLINWVQQTTMAEFPAHVALVNHWLSDSAFNNFAQTYQRWQNDGNPLGDDAYAIMQLLTLGHLPVSELGIGLMRIATEDQREAVTGSDGSEWHTDVILSEELFYIPQDVPGTK